MSPGPSSVGTAQPRMRADAQRNRQQILRAARQVFVDQGPDAPLDEIARRAGVGIATLYRRFPKRSDLVEGVVVDVMAALIEAADEAIAEEDDAFRALRRFMHAALDLKIGATMPAFVGRVTVDTALGGLQRDAVDPVQELLSRAQAAGQVRRDVVLGDISAMMIRLSRPLPGGPFPADEELAHRQLEIYVDGLRAPAAGSSYTTLPGPAIDAEQFRRIRDELISTPADPQAPRSARSRRRRS